MSKQQRLQERQMDSNYATLDSPIVRSASPNSISLPPSIIDASAWYGSDLARSSDWIERLSETETAEVESAVRQFENSTTRLLAGSPPPLPSLAPRLQELLNEVLNGRGFVLIKGLPI